MARQEFHAAVPGLGFMRSLPWGVVAGALTLMGLVLLVMGLAKTGGKDLLVGAALILIGAVHAFSWYRLRQPLVILEEDAVLWRSGLGLRRHVLGDLAISPDPFDVTVLRLQTRGGKFLRLPRDGVARVAELERMLQERLTQGVAGRALGAGTGDGRWEQVSVGSDRGFEGSAPPTP